MAYHKVVSKLMDFSINSYYIWKKEDRPIISLLHKYLTEKDIEEFLETGSISKFDNIQYSKEDIYQEYLMFIANFTNQELLIFLKLIKKNQENLSSFSQNFIKEVIKFKCEEDIKVKLIEEYSKVIDKNKLFYLGLNLLIKEEFRGFYNYVKNYEIHMPLFHIIEYLNAFKGIKVKNIEEYFPQLKDSEYVKKCEEEEDYQSLDFSDEYYDKLLKLL
ncbi:hypothetical protein [Halarcobacter sp.]|uniref:hypothetical protein n=1 Tax=Halarcobacter sp. TaxID=2321133 RepID=UPI002AA6DE75|nr:hypothetical protein [Halarcobacter sp.]